MTNTLAAAYRPQQRLTGGARSIEAGVLGHLADHERRHGLLAGDDTPAGAAGPTKAARDPAEAT